MLVVSHPFSSYMVVYERVIILFVRLCFLLKRTEGY